MAANISVVIPLYNKEEEIAQTLQNVLGQSLQPCEILVVDDGSTDRSASVVEEIAAANPLVRLIGQANGGVSAARNRGVEESSGEYVAFLDGDDTWSAEFLEEMERLTENYPACGMYCSGCNIRREDGVFPNETGMEEGVVDNYFRTAMRRGITNASGVVIPKAVFADLGGFPLGMKLGEDLYMWTKIASAYPVCYTPLKLVTVNVTSTNRSANNYRMEDTAHSFREFYNPDDYWRNEYIAWAEIGRGTVFSVNGYSAQAREIEKFYDYSREYRQGWLRLWALNRLAPSLRPGANNIYRKLAWVLAKKGRFE